MAEKEKIYLTDITLHTRDFRQTLNFSKVAKKGRMYSPMPKDYQKNTSGEVGSGRFKISIKLPTDLQVRVDRDEVELMIPKDGLVVLAGRDIIELIQKMESQERTQLIHRSRGQVWRKE